MAAKEILEFLKTISVDPKALVELNAATLQSLLLADKRLRFNPEESLRHGIVLPGYGKRGNKPENIRMRREAVTILARWITSRVPKKYHANIRFYEEVSDYGFELQIGVGYFPDSEIKDNAWYGQKTYLEQFAEGKIESAQMKEKDRELNKTFRSLDL